MLHILRHIKNNEKAITQMQTLCLRNEFQQAINELDKKIGYKVWESIQSPIDLLNNPKIRTEIRTTMRYFDLHMGWEYFIAYCVMYQTIPKDFNPSLPYLETFDGEFGVDPLNKEPVFQLRLFPTTTKPDILNVLGQIKAIVSTKPIRIRKKRNAMRDAYIMELHASKKTPKAIATIINQKYPGKLLMDVDINNVIYKSKKMANNKPK